MIQQITNILIPNTFPMPITEPQGLEENAKTDTTEASTAERRARCQGWAAMARLDKRWRKSEKKEDAGARKGRKVAFHCGFSNDLWLRGVEKEAR